MSTNQFNDNQFNQQQITTTNTEKEYRTMATDDKVLIGLTHGSNEPENVLISYLTGVEALRAGKQAVMWLTKEGIEVATEGFAATVDVPGAPKVLDLHEEFVSSGGRFLVCPVCVKLREQQDAKWVDSAEVKGVPAVFEYTSGGALVFNY